MPLVADPLALSGSDMVPDSWLRLPTAHSLCHNALEPDTRILTKPAGSQTRSPYSVAGSTSGSRLTDRAQLPDFVRACFCTLKKLTSALKFDSQAKPITGVRFTGGEKVADKTNQQAA